MATTVKMLMTAFSCSEMGIFSRLQCGESNLFVLEPPWDTNNPFDQCIPAGVYDVIRVPSDEENDDWLVTGLSERNAITFALGNIRDDTAGNLLLGNNLGTKGDAWAVLNTAETMKQFNEWLDGVNEFRLYIDRKIINQDMNLNAR